MKNDPLAVLVKHFTPEEKEIHRAYWEAQQLERAKNKQKRFSRIPPHMVILWCEWNRKCEGSAERLAYEFGKYFKSEVLREWNKPTIEELKALKLKKKQARRIKYNEYMRNYLKSYRAKKLSLSSPDR